MAVDDAADRADDMRSYKGRNDKHAERDSQDQQLIWWIEQLQNAFLVRGCEREKGEHRAVLSSAICKLLPSRELFFLYY